MISIDCSRKGGQTTVEFALILWPFLMLLFATCDYGQMYFYEGSLRYALREAGRFATPGNVLTTNMLTTTGPLKSAYTNGPMSRNESIRDWFLSNSLINVPVQSIVIQSWPGGPNGTYTQAVPEKGPGLAGDYLQIIVNQQIPLITPVANLLFSNGIYNLTVTAIFINEPFTTTNVVMYTNEP